MMALTSSLANTLAWLASRTLMSLPRSGNTPYRSRPMRFEGITTKSGLRESTTTRSTDDAQTGHGKRLSGVTFSEDEHALVRQSASGEVRIHELFYASNIPSEKGTQR